MPNGQSGAAISHKDDQESRARFAGFGVPYD